MFMEKGTLIGLRNSRTYVLNVSGNKEWVPGLGVIETSRFLDKNYGDEVSIFDHKFTVVKPGLEDILRNMEKITQAVSVKDIGLMIVKSGIRCGSNVAEVGVGSGFLSVAILYYIKPGKLYGYDISEKNLEHVKGVVEWLGWKDYFIPVMVNGDLEFTKNDLDAIFMDIPDPSILLEKSHQALTVNGTVIAYLPNITQVQKFIFGSREIGFREWSVYEVIQREWVVGERELRPVNEGLLHTAFVVTLWK